jgi:hypothetical protein
MLCGKKSELGVRADVKRGNPFLLGSTQLGFRSLKNNGTLLRLTKTYSKNVPSDHELVARGRIRAIIFFALLTKTTIRIDRS